MFLFIGDYPPNIEIFILESHSTVSQLLLSLFFGWLITDTSFQLMYSFARSTQKRRLLRELSDKKQNLYAWSAVLTVVMVGKRMRIHLPMEIVF